MIKRFFSIAIMFFSSLIMFSACSEPANTKIGISMPTKSLQRWNQDGDNMKKAFEEVGYTVDLEYAGDNDVQTQISQVEKMIEDNYKVIIIAAIEGDSLSNVLKKAKSKNIPIISYDRLIMNSDAVSYYATFDNFKIGVIQGEYIKNALDLDNSDGVFNIEMFTGDSGDNNINYFFDGAVQVLRPYFDSGKLKVLSGETTKAKCSTPGWKTENAQNRMEKLIVARGYGPNGTKLDAVLSSNDSCAIGITNALVNVGYEKENFPILTGQDCDMDAVKNIISGTQNMSIFKDTRILAAKVVEMVEAIVNEDIVPVNNTTDYNNGVIDIPTYLCEPVFVDAENYKSLLIDSGYYTEEQLQVS